MKYLVSSLFFLMSTVNIAQKVNDYQYVIVPEKYDFLKRADQHQLNSLTKFLLNKYGFEAYLEIDEKPFKMVDAACDILYADLADDTNFIQTRLALVLKDCKGETIYKTTQGRSKKKEYKAAYHEALRDAFADIQSIKHVYNGNKKVATAEPVKKATLAEEVQEAKGTLKEPQHNFVLEVEEEETVSEVKETDAIKVDSSTLYADEDDSIKDNTVQVIFMSEDNFYKAIRLDDTITFYEGSKNIGNSSILREDGFLVTTSQFEGEAFFKEGRLIIERKIKGVVGVVEMIFTKQ